MNCTAATAAACQTEPEQSTMLFSRPLRADSDSLSFFFSTVAAGYMALQKHSSACCSASFGNFGTLALLCVPASVNFLVVLSKRMCS